MDYKQLINREEKIKPKSYPLGKKQKGFINTILEKIFPIVRKWGLNDIVNTFGGSKVPRPLPELRIKPKM